MPTLCKRAGSPRSPSQEPQYKHTKTAHLTSHSPPYDKGDLEIQSKKKEEAAKVTASNASADRGKRCARSATPRASQATNSDGEDVSDSGKDNDDMNDEDQEHPGQEEDENSDAGENEDNVKSAAPSITSVATAHSRRESASSAQKPPIPDAETVKTRRVENKKANDLHASTSIAKPGKPGDKANKPAKKIGKTTLSKSVRDSMLQGFGTDGSMAADDDVTVPINSVDEEKVSRGSIEASVQHEDEQGATAPENGQNHLANDIVTEHAEHVKTSPYRTVAELPQNKKKNDEGKALSPGGKPSGAYDKIKPVVEDSVDAAKAGGASTESKEKDVVKQAVEQVIETSSEHTDQMLTGEPTGIACGDAGADQNAGTEIDARDMSPMSQRYAPLDIVAASPSMDSMSNVQTHTAFEMSSHHPPEHITPIQEADSTNEKRKAEIIEHMFSEPVTIDAMRSQNESWTVIVKALNKERAQKGINAKITAAEAYSKYILAKSGIEDPKAAIRDVTNEDLAARDHSSIVQMNRVNADEETSVATSGRRNFWSSKREKVLAGAVKQVKANYWLNVANIFEKEVGLRILPGDCEKHWLEQGGNTDPASLMIENDGDKTTDRNDKQQ